MKKSQAKQAGVPELKLLKMAPLKPRTSEAADSTRSGKRQFWFGDEAVSSHNASR
jgi:hypothetical protein